MKTNVTLRSLFISAVLMFVLAAITQAQPDYVFRNAELEYGTDLQIGAKYRFRDVRPGMDAILEIKDMTGGMTLNQLDGGSGFDEAFQPYINCAPKKKGYVEFELNLVAPGTYTNVFAAELPLTAIDIDGWEFPDDKLYETDEFEKSSSFYSRYDLLGSNLDIKDASGWVSVINKSAITYDGIDTLQKDVMFTAVHADVTKILFRVGADNKSKEPMTRLRSVYFKKFEFPNGILPLSFLSGFAGSVDGNEVSLHWSFRNGSEIKAEQLELSTDGRSFSTVMARLSTGSAGDLSTDWEGRMTTPLEYYRLRLEHRNGAVEYSRILVFRNESGSNTDMRIYPNLVQDQATLQLQSASNEAGTYALYDPSGRMVRQQAFRLSKGMNNIPLDGLSSLQRGQYFVVVQYAGTKQTGKMMRL